jgi:hypothetical protein
VCSSRFDRCVKLSHVVNHVQYDANDSFNDFVLNELNDSSSSDDDENFYFEAAKIVTDTLIDEPIHHGSIIGHRTVDRERLSWHNLLYHDYFSEKPVFGPKFFRRR